MGQTPTDVKITKTLGPNGVDVTTAMLLQFDNGVIADLLCGINGFMDETAVISGTNGIIKQYHFYGCRKTELCGPTGNVLDSYIDLQEEGFVHEIDHFAKTFYEGKMESSLIPVADTLDFAKMVSKYFYG